MDKIDISFLENISKLTKYERLAKIKKITNKYDKLLLIELINELTAIEIDFIYKFNDSLNNEPCEKPILNEGDISLSLLNFTFFEIRQINHTIFEIVSYQQEHFFNKLDYKDLNTAHQYIDIIDELIFILNDKYKDIINLNSKCVDNTELKSLNVISKNIDIIDDNFYVPNLTLERYPLNEGTIKWLRIDYDNLSNEEIHNELNSIEDVFVDFDNEFIYTGVLSIHDDIKYSELLKELNIPFISDVFKIIQPIEDEKIRNSLLSKGIIKILEAQYNAKDKIVDKLFSEFSTKINSKFNPNHFNNDCYNLFCYLVNNYKKPGKIKFINIYYYLKDEVKKDKYSFRFIQNDYTKFIKENYNIEIKKYQKAMFDYDEQKRVLNSLEEQFRKQ